MKKAICLLFSILLLASAHPVFSAFSENVILISSVAELLNIGKDSSYPMSGSYRLTADLDLSSVTWVPIGQESGTAKVPFTGTFDGDGHVIRNMHSGTEMEEYTVSTNGWGMFAYLSGATVKNLIFENVCFNLITSQPSSIYLAMGTLAGYTAKATKVTNVAVVSGLLKCTRPYQVRIGGIIGGMTSSSGLEVSGCYTACTIEGGWDAAKSGSAGSLAGIVGNNGSSSVTGTVRNCVSVCNIKATSSQSTYVGGLVSASGGERLYSKFTVTDCYYLADAVCDNGATILPSPDYGTGFTVNDFSGVTAGLPGLEEGWTFSSGYYPILTLARAYQKKIVPVEETDTVIPIATLSDLQKIGKDNAFPLNGEYILTADIDCAGVAWEPIGYSTQGTFSGIFDGNGYTIRNLHSGTDAEPVSVEAGGWGLFRAVRGTVKNLVLSDVFFHVITPGTYNALGALCGYISGPAVIENVAVVSGTLKDTGSRQIRSGGLVGASVSPAGYTIKNCFNGADVVSGLPVSGSNLLLGSAGIVGSSPTYAGTIAFCVSVGNVTVDGWGFAGGLVSSYDRSAPKMDIINSYYWEDGICSIEKMQWNGTGGTAVTKENLLNGSLAIALDNTFWTVREGYYPYLNIMQGQAPFIGTQTVCSVAEHVRMALEDFFYTNGTTEESLEAYLKELVWTSGYSVTVNDLLISKATPFEAGSLTCIVEVTDGREAEDIPVNRVLAVIPQMKVDFTSSSVGRADGMVTVVRSGGAVSDGTYTLRWGNGTGYDEKYQPVCAKPEADMVTFTLGYKTQIPENATHLWLCLDGIPLCSYPIPESKQLTDKTLGELQYAFGMVADIHINAKTSAGSAHHTQNFVYALQAMNQMDFLDAIFFAGDITTYATDNAYAILKENLDRYNALPIYAVVGNHDILSKHTGIKDLESSFLRFQQVFPNTKDINYTVTDSSGNLYVFLGIGHEGLDAQALTASQIAWLDNTLAQYYAKTDRGHAFLICHFAPQKTIDPRDKDVLAVASSDALKAVVSKYPQLVYFSGHSHYAFALDANFYDGNDTFCNLLHIPSLGSSVILNAENAAENIANADGYIVKVYENHVLVQGYDFIRDQYVTMAMFAVVDKTETVECSGVVTWEHGENPVADRPSCLTVQLKNGLQTVETCTVTADSNWAFSFTVPKYDAVGNRIVYTIDSVSVPGYTEQVDGWQIKNTFMPDSPSTDVDSDSDTSPETGDYGASGWGVLILSIFAVAVGTLIFAYLGKKQKK